MTSEIKNRTKQGKRPATEFKRAEFINHSFNADDKARFKQWAETQAGELWSLIDSLVDSGYSLSIKRDNYNDCFAAYLQPSDEKNPNYGFILTGRARSGSLAIFAVLFRHLAIFEGQWPIREARPSGLDDE